MPSNAQSQIETMELTTNKDAFQLKGSLFTLTVLQLLSTELASIAEQLTQLIEKSRKFFQHAPIVIDLSQLSSNEENIDFAGINTLLCEHTLIPVGVRGGTAKQHQMAKSAGLAVLPDSKANAMLSGRQQTLKQSTQKFDSRQTQLITNQVRSGQHIYAENSDLIVIGSVSNGAEVIADGHIHIYGSLRGRALAGANGNQNANIFCRDFQAEMVSIAGRYRLPDDQVANQSEQAVRIYLREGRICIDKC